MIRKLRHAAQELDRVCTRHLTSQILRKLYLEAVEEAPPPEMIELLGRLEANGGRQ